MLLSNGMGRRLWYMTGKSDYNGAVLDEELRRRCV